MQGSFSSLFIFLTAMLSLSGCSQFGQPPTAQTSDKSQDWHYQVDVDIGDFPIKLAALTGGRVSVRGQCHFSEDLLRLYKQSRHGVMLPFLQALEDGSAIPAYEASVPVFQTLQQYWQLASATDSVQLYQRWVSSAEQACPVNLSRNNSQCSFKKLYSVGRLWNAQRPLYNFERLNLWLSNKKEFRYLVVPGLNLLNSENAYNLRYSPRSRPVVNMAASERRNNIQSYLGRSSIDWVLLGSKGQVPEGLPSLGSCFVSWREFDELRHQNPEKIDFASLIAVDDALRSLLLSFINDVFAATPFEPKSDR